MSSVKLDAEREVCETGVEPEFIVYDLPKFESAGDGLIRVYVASRRGRFDKIEYSFVCSLERLAFMCRKGLMFVAEAHNMMEFVEQRLTEH